MDSTTSREFVFWVDTLNGLSIYDLKKQMLRRLGLFPAALGRICQREDDGDYDDDDSILEKPYINCNDNGARNAEARPSQNWTSGCCGPRNGAMANRGNGSAVGCECRLVPRGDVSESSVNGMMFGRAEADVLVAEAKVEEILGVILRRTDVGRAIDCPSSGDFGAKLTLVDLEGLDISGVNINGKKAVYASYWSERSPREAWSWYSRKWREKGWEEERPLFCLKLS
ncbi:hypothetical protein MLD38_000998 [Melastoma candidum]|uniref:Uncharacterized protein n=1 Tax=Melastoma candidum TaxID=119954 RepID=A0ACB9SBU3_9MYRT|nr:hypothetical protein MLD38_000998 [Melastoma candidum]